MQSVYVEHIWSPILTYFGHASLVNNNNCSGRYFPHNFSVISSMASPALICHYVTSTISDVGRSCILVSLSGKNIMLDCGMHMGFNDDVRRVTSLSRVVFVSQSIFP